MKDLLAAEGVGLEVRHGFERASASSSDECDLEWARTESFRHLPRLLGTNAHHLSFPRCDLIVVEHSLSNVAAWTLMRGKQPYAVWGHGVFGHGSALRRKLLLRMSRNANWWFSYAPSSTESVVASGFPADRVTTLFNSVRTHTPCDRVEAAAPSANRTILFVGALRQGKGVLELARVSSRLSQGHPDFELLIVGDGPLRAELAQLQSRQLRLLGPKFGRELAETISSADLLVIPSEVGLIAVESLRYGTPIVTFAEGNHGPEFSYLTDETSFILEGRVSEHQLERALIDILAQDSDIERRRLRGLAVGADLTLERMAENFAAGIVSALGTANA